MAKRTVFDDIARLKLKHGRDRSLARSFPDLSCKPGAPSLSDGFAPITDNRAKTLADRFRNEEKRVADEIAAKASRIRPHYNKGAYQYATDDVSPIGIYRK
jgi:hypothetical protein